MERVQKEQPNWINFSSSLGYEEWMRKLGLFSLKYRRLRSGHIKVFKFIIGRHAVYIGDMFETS